MMSLASIAMQKRLHQDNDCKNEWEPLETFLKARHAVMWSPSNSDKMIAHKYQVPVCLYVSSVSNLPIVLEKSNLEIISHVLPSKAREQLKLSKIYPASTYSNHNSSKYKQTTDHYHSDTTNNHDYTPESIMDRIFTLVPRVRDQTFKYASCCSAFFNLVRGEIITLDDTQQHLLEQDCTNYDGPTSSLPNGSSASCGSGSSGNEKEDTNQIFQVTSSSSSSSSNTTTASSYSINDCRHSPIYIVYDEHVGIVPSVKIRFWNDIRSRLDMIEKECQIVRNMQVNLELSKRTIIKMKKDSEEDKSILNSAVAAATAAVQESPRPVHFITSDHVYKIKHIESAYNTRIAQMKAIHPSIDTKNYVLISTWYRMLFLRDHMSFLYDTPVIKRKRNHNHTPENMNNGSATSTPFSYTSSSASSSSSSSSSSPSTFSQASDDEKKQNIKRGCNYSVYQCLLQAILDCGYDDLMIRICLNNSIYNYAVNFALLNMWLMDCSILTCATDHDTRMSVTKNDIPYYQNVYDKLSKDLNMPLSEMKIYLTKHMVDYCSLPNLTVNLIQKKRLYFSFTKAMNDFLVCKT
jgi:hypothetical protein